MMPGFVAELFRRIRYRRRWHALAAAAQSAADGATADLNRRVRDRDCRHRPGERSAVLPKPPLRGA